MSLTENIVITADLLYLGFPSFQTAACPSYFTKCFKFVSRFLTDWYLLGLLSFNLQPILILTYVTETLMVSWISTYNAFQFIDVFLDSEMPRKWGRQCPAQSCIWGGVSPDVHRDNIWDGSSDTRSSDMPVMKFGSCASPFNRRGICNNTSTTFIFQLTIHFNFWHMSREIWWRISTYIHVTAAVPLSASYIETLLWDFLPIDLRIEKRQKSTERKSSQVTVTSI